MRAAPWPALLAGGLHLAQLLRLQRQREFRVAGLLRLADLLREVRRGARAGSLRRIRARNTRTGLGRGPVRLARQQVVQGRRDGVPVHGAVVGDVGAALERVDRVQRILETPGGQRLDLGRHGQPGCLLGTRLRLLQRVRLPLGLGLVAVLVLLEPRGLLPGLVLGFLGPLLPGREGLLPGRRERILAAVLDLIAEDGVAGVSHRKAAARAGVPLGSMTYHFASMDELLR
ncbi:TetR/AcrR family transcriptional regulator, partial [Peribacillus sp. NPDC060253]|uniref:TetR/AcrR family transcriptional regulator n=1 Tax=Peribacillus sp. NPDC060253 TaxID=3347084 RepID=UPI0036675CF8